jgi:hypothetical protein
MAISLNNLVYDILETASSGGLPNEFKVSTNQIKYWIEQTRAMLIGQSLSKRDDINDTWVQYISCLDLSQVDASLCCDLQSGCYLLKSNKQLPSTIDTYRDNWLVSVTTLEGEQISKSNPIKSKYQKYNKYSKSSKSWYIKDNYLYIINDQLLQTVSVAGLFEHPEDLSNFVDCSGQNCFTDDSTYPISVNMASDITNIVLQTKVNPFMTYSMDQSNDANGATPLQRQQKNKANHRSNDIQQ